MSEIKLQSGANVLQHLLICGLGSIGRRHLRHFRDLGVARIDAYSTGLGTMPILSGSEPDNTYSSLEEALLQKPQAAVICNPTSLHAETGLKCLEAGCHLLIEKPVDSDPSKASALLKTQKTSGLVVAVAHNMRFHPALKFLKKGIQERRWGEGLIATAHFGNYLPDWHPWEDYTQSYAARKELGGGAVLTHIHEIDFSEWLWGNGVSYAGLTSEKRSIGTDVDECAGVIIKHSSGVLSSITLSLSQKPATRDLRISFSKGNLHLDLLTANVDFTDKDGVSHTVFSDPKFDIDETYGLQAQGFIDAVVGKNSPLCTLQEAATSLAIAVSVTKDATVPGL